MRMLLSDDEIRAKWREMSALGGNVMRYFAVGTIEVTPGRILTAVVAVAPSSGDCPEKSAAQADVVSPPFRSL